MKKKKQMLAMFLATVVLGNCFTGTIGVKAEEATIIKPMTLKMKEQGETKEQEETKAQGDERTEGYKGVGK